MSDQSATVMEIGRRAGCSIATVSRVLNNSGAVSAKTRESILKAMRETQYLAVRSARRSNRGRATGGVVEIVQHRHSPWERLSVAPGKVEVGPLEDVPKGGIPRTVGTSFFQRIVDGAVDELGRWGYRAQLRVDSDLLDADLLADINWPSRNGILLLGEASADVAKFMKQCLHPLVLVDVIYDGSVDVVTSDNYAGIQSTFNHLYELGHRRIGFVGKRDEVPAFVERFTMYKLKMAEAALAVRPEWIYEGHDHIDRTTAGVRRILELADRPSALVCANDCYALGVLRSASQLGISIPGELSVVGFDDEDFAAMVTPPLTTVRVPLQEMGRQAVRQLMIPMLGGPVPARRGVVVRLAPELIVRGSATVSEKQGIKEAEL